MAWATRQRRVERDAIVSKQLDWLLGEEDHGVFVGVGRPVVERLQAVFAEPTAAADAGHM